MPIFAHEAKFKASKDEIWNWYNSDGAFRRIMPEWEGIQPINAGRLVDGDETIFKVKVNKVNTSILRGKGKTFKGQYGFRKDTKRAIVTLDEGNTIDSSLEIK